MREGSVYEALLRGALLPDTGVDGSFVKDRAVVAGDEMDVSGERGEGGVPGAAPARVGGGEGWGWWGCRLGGTSLREGPARGESSSPGEGRQTKKITSLQIWSSRSHDNSVALAGRR